MNKRDEDYLFKLLERIDKETHQNNIMLKQICNAVNVYLKNHNRENEDDFGRNVLANLMSNIFDIKTIRK